MNQVSDKIWNIFTCTINFGEVMQLTWVIMKKNDGEFSSGKEDSFK